jgi:hypothetical protein
VHFSVYMTVLLPQLTCLRPSKCQWGNCSSTPKATENCCIEEDHLAQIMALSGEQFTPDFLNTCALKKMISLLQTVSYTLHPHTGNPDHDVNRFTSPSSASKRLPNDTRTCARHLSHAQYGGHHRSRGLNPSQKSVETERDETRRKGAKRALVYARTCSYALVCSRTLSRIWTILDFRRVLAGRKEFLRALTRFSSFLLDAIIIFIVYYYNTRI